MRLPPLTPRSGGGLCIDQAALKPADIVVSTTDAAVSGVIRFFTGAPISHAMLYAGSGEAIEAVGEGVRRTALNNALAHGRLAVAYRYKGLPDDAASKVVDYADAQARRHAPYDTPGAIGAGANTNKLVCVVALGIACPAVAGGALNQKDSFFCSELVLEAFQRAGYPISKIPPGSAGPDRILEAYSHGVLTYVGHILTN